jgi:hypothetical protein
MRGIIMKKLQLVFLFAVAALATSSQALDIVTKQVILDPRFVDVSGTYGFNIRDFGVDLTISQDINYNLSGQATITKVDSPEEHQVDLTGQLNFRGASPCVLELEPIISEGLGIVLKFRLSGDVHGFRGSALVRLPDSRPQSSRVEFVPLNQNYGATINIEILEQDSEMALGIGHLSLPHLPAPVQVPTVQNHGHRPYLLIGGISDSNPVKFESRVPIIGHGPVLGGLFRGRARVKEEGDLLIFVRPTILLE